jgi:hypothetical protein
MAVAQGSCPGCGSPIQFGVGSSIAKVCEYCRVTVVRSDRGLQNLGKVADLANTPSLIAVGDEGTLSGRPFQVLGRVQLDHGKGPWDEYYVGFDHGQSWGWLAYAQGHWYVTSLVAPVPVPPYAALAVEMDLAIGQAWFRVAEVKTGRVVSAEGELPGALRPGFVRHYADLYGQQNAFATLDYGDNTGGHQVFTGWIFTEPQLQVTQLGQRSVQKVKTTHIKCPNCGGDVPKLSGDRAERLGCPYCGAVSDIAARQVVAQQEAAMKLPDIPIGTRGVFDGVEYLCIAYVRRSTEIQGEHFAWEEYLLWSQAIGFRWLVKDETSWMWVVPVNLAELDLRAMPSHAGWGGRSFSLRNQNVARVDYVLGEVYWKCEVGETTRVTDLVNGADVLSREESPGEVRWSYSTPVPWAILAQSFGLPMDSPAARFAAAPAGAAAPSGGCAQSMVLLLVVGIILLVCMLGACGECAGGGGVGGGGIFIGGGK